MAKLRFTPHLRRFFPKLEEGPVQGVTVAEVIRALDQKHPGLAA